MADREKADRRNALADKLEAKANQVPPPHDAAEMLKAARLMRALASVAMAMPNPQDTSKEAMDARTREDRSTPKQSR